MVCYGRFQEEREVKTQKPILLPAKDHKEPQLVAGVRIRQVTHLQSGIRKVPRKPGTWKILIVLMVITNSHQEVLK
jgi:hypothetical protein